MSKQRSAGFTLVELLVVIVIIGVLASMVSLSIGGRAVDDRMQSESRRLEELIRLASDEAQAKGLELGFRQTLEGFEFLSVDGTTGEWAAFDEGLFRPRQVPEPFTLELRIDGRVIKPVKVAEKKEAEGEKDGKEKKFFDNEASKKADDEKNEPQVLILSTGEMTAFTLDLKLKDLATFYRVEGNALGELSSARKEEKR
ncbi:MAG: type II secretion system minor pseudopilin GspH [Panacagrimonas sp.]